VIPTKPQAGARLVSYVPEDDETRARLEQLRLAAGPGRPAGGDGGSAAARPGGRAPGNSHRQPRPWPSHVQTRDGQSLVPAEA